MAFKGPLVIEVNVIKGTILTFIPLVLLTIQVNVVSSLSDWHIANDGAYCPQNAHLTAQCER